MILTQVEVKCCECGMEFTMPQSFYNMRYADGKTFYCPAGHSQYYTRKEKEIEKLKKEKQNLETRLQWANHEAQQEKRSHAATKGKLTKFRNRVANGVCPCCHRTFKQLAAHMSNKHPDFKAVAS